MTTNERWTKTRVDSNFDSNKTNFTTKNGWKKISKPKKKPTRTSKQQITSFVGRRLFSVKNESSDSLTRVSRILFFEFVFVCTRSSSPSSSDSRFQKILGSTVHAVGIFYFIVSLSLYHESVRAYINENYTQCLPKTRRKTSNYSRLLDFRSFASKTFDKLDIS